MTRREFSKAIRANAFARANGHCEKCSVKLTVGKFAFDHVLPDGLGGEATLDNCEVLCAACHGAKTAKVDVPQIAKMKRQRAAHLGLKQKGRGFPPARRRGGASKPLTKQLPPRRLGI
jgi:5-methylcytosine-specific restriction endonuclease McrA